MDVVFQVPRATTARCAAGWSLVFGATALSPNAKEWHEIRFAYSFAIHVIFRTFAAVLTRADHGLRWSVRATCMKARHGSYRNGFGVTPKSASIELAEKLENGIASLRRACCRTGLAERMAQEEEPRHSVGWTRFTALCGRLQGKDGENKHVQQSISVAVANGASRAVYKNGIGQYMAWLRLRPRRLIARMHTGSVAHLH